MAATAVNPLTAKAAPYSLNPESSYQVKNIFQESEDGVSHTCILLYQVNNGATNNGDYNETPIGPHFLTAEIPAVQFGHVDGRGVQ